MRLFHLSPAICFASLLFSPTTMLAQNVAPRTWFDLQGGVAYESPGGSSFASSAALRLTLAGSLRLTASTALQLAADEFTSSTANATVCVHDPGNGGCSYVGGDRFHAMGATASIAFISGDGRTPDWTASVGAGPYWVGSSGQTSLGLRATIERLLVGSKTNGLTASAGALVLPMGQGAPISLYSLGLGLRVW